MSDTHPGRHRHSHHDPDRLRASVLERPAAGRPRTAVVFIHGNVSSSLFFQPTMLALPADVRGHRDRPARLRRQRDAAGRRDARRCATSRTTSPRCSTRSALEPVHLVGWSMGGGVVHAAAARPPGPCVATLTLSRPVSPVRLRRHDRRDGRMLTPTAPERAAAGANPDFVARLAGRRHAATTRRRRRGTSTAATYVKHAGDTSRHEDLWVESMLSTKTGRGQLPGRLDAIGKLARLRARAPRRAQHDGARCTSTSPASPTSPTKPPILWIRGTDDAIVSDTSFFDLNYPRPARRDPRLAGRGGRAAAADDRADARGARPYADDGRLVRELDWPTAGTRRTSSSPDEFARRSRRTSRRS